MSKNLTAGEIGKIVDIMLDMRGCETWTNNNFKSPHTGRFRGRKGSTDRIGFHRKTGLFVACEIKTYNDKLSGDQKMFLGLVVLAGGIALLGVQDKKTGNVILKDYAEELKNPEY